MLLDALSEEMRSAFFLAIQTIVDEAVLNEIEQAVADGDAQRIVDLLGFSPASLRPISRAFEDMFERSGDWVNDSYPRLPNNPVIRFDLRNPRAEQWLRYKSSSLITNITDDARSNVVAMLAAGMEAGRNPRNTALDIVGRIDPTTGKRVGGVIGLSEQQQFWSRSFRTDLEQLNPRYFDKALRDKRFDPIVRRAIESGQPLSKAQIDKMVYRYRDNALRHRGEQIGRTESLAALNAAELESVRQLLERDIVREKDVGREWDSAGDGKVRNSHKLMDGQVVGIDEPFITPAGFGMMHPGDNSLGAPANEIIGCRCRAKTKIDWIGATMRERVNDQ